MGQLCNVKVILNQRYVQRQQREMRKKCKYFSQDEKPGAHERFNASLCNSEQKKKTKQKTLQQQAASQMNQQKGSPLAS